MLFHSDKSEKHAAGFSAWQLREISLNFAIGEQIHLRPEHVDGLQLSSIVVGLRVNGQVIYSNEGVSWDEAAQSITFRSLDADKPITHVKAFSLLMPLEQSDEREMSYEHKEALDRVGLFSRGNTVTASTMVGGHRSLAVDGKVVDFLQLEQGLFANHEVAELRLDPNSFVISERRRHPRLMTDVPVQISTAKGGIAFNAKLLDFVEEAMHLAVDKPEATAYLPVGKAVTLELELNELQRHYRLRGAVIKADEEGVVVELRHIFKDDTLSPYSKLDAIEVKAMLGKLSQSHLE